MEDLNNKRNLSKYDKYILFFVIYTISFFLFFKTLGYTIPFVLALIIAAIIVKPIRWFARKFKIKETNSLLVLTFLILIFGSIASLITWLIIKLVNQIGQLANSGYDFFNKNYDSIAKWFQRQYDWVVSNLSSVDPDIVESGRDVVKDSVTYLKDGLLGLGSTLGNFTINLASSLPTFFLIIIFTIVCSFLFAKVILKNPKFIYKFLPISSSQKDKLESITEESKNMLLKYGMSYLIIISITGAISTIAYFILGVPYALLLGLLTAFLDLLPVLGVAATYVPIALYYLYLGNYTIPIGIAILYVVVTIGRNIWEPKIVSSSLDISPIITIMAIFIGLKLNGIAGMIYFIFMAVTFKILQNVGVLDSLEDKNK
ncbi:MAG: sporulation integral membrane protein YtvI [Clostridium sp.]|nr:sporulation integral membrane protein YtvI [Clostridium sp.]